MYVCVCRVLFKGLIPSNAGEYFLICCLLAVACLFKEWLHTFREGLAKKSKGVRLTKYGNKQNHLAENLLDEEDEDHKPK